MTSVYCDDQVKNRMHSLFKNKCSNRLLSMDFDNRTILVLSKSQQIRVILLFLLFINQALLINPLLSFVSLLVFVFLSLFAFVFVCLLFVPTISGKSVLKTGFVFIWPCLGSQVHVKRSRCMLQPSENSVNFL